MAEFIQLLRDVQDEPKDQQQHLFCPRIGDGENDRYEEDEDEDKFNKLEDPQRKDKITRAKDRRKKFVRSFQLLAFDGAECQPYHARIYEMLDQSLKECELCVRRYYLERLDFEAYLRQEYDEGDVKEFMSILNRRDIARIKEGLTSATQSLQATPEQKRGISALEYPALVALFEALHNQAFHTDEALLEQFFDLPFKLVQTKKPLRLGEIVPAVTKFLFDPKGTRLAWAVWVWRRLPRQPTNLEWDYAIKTYLQKMYHTSNDPKSSSRLWSGLKVIVRRLSKEQIIYKLFDMNPPFSRLALDHLAQPTYGIPHIVNTLAYVLDTAPAAFWQLMGSISSSTLVESVFGSPYFDKCLEMSVKAETAEETDVLTWIPSFLQSMAPANRPAACHTLVFQLFQRVNSDKFSDEARKACFGMAVKVMQYTLSSFSDDENERKSTHRLVLIDALNNISTYLDQLLQPRIRLESDEIRKDVTNVVRHAIALDCQCLKSDFENLRDGHPLGHEKSSYSPDIWRAVIDNLHEDDTDLSSVAINGIMAFPGLDRLRFKTNAVNPSDDKSPAAELRRQQDSFNAIYDNITAMIGQLLEKLSEFKPDHLDILFRTQNTNMVLIACLFSGDTAIYQATVELIKNISGELGRKEAIAHLLGAFFSITLYGIDWAFRRIATMRTFACIPRMLKTGMEILEVLCDSTGLLRTQELDSRGAAAVQSYWSYQWLALRTVFRQTEPWSFEVHDKTLMSNVCRDAMQYARELFQQYHLFLSVLQRGNPDNAEEIPQSLLNTDEALPICSPPKALDSMSRWLRLRDDYLADTLVKLITGMLKRLKEYGSNISEENLHYVINVVSKTHSEKGYVKTVLTAQQKAELVRALESYLGKPVIRHPEPKKQSTLKNWTTVDDRSGSSTPASTVIEIDDFDDEDIKDEDLQKLSELHDKLQKEKVPKEKIVPKPKQSLPSRPSTPANVIAQASRKTADAKAFIENRKREEAVRKARDREAALRLRGKTGVGEQTAGAGSGLSGIGVQGKDHSLGQSSIMVSSESETDSSDDDELFGKVKSLPAASAGLRKKPVSVGPVRKIKQIRSQKDIRARLTPDLSALHKEILGWDFFADTDTPPSSSKTDYTLVSNTFRSAADYVKTFEPLLVLEGWQSFRTAREDGNFRPFEIKVANSLIVDHFLEINSTMPMSESKDLGLSVSDVVLLSKGNQPATQKDQPHCLARVKEITRKRGEVQVVYRVNAAQNPLRSCLNDKATVYAVQMLSLTPLEREYSALMALEYYDLCDEIIQAKPSPLIDYNTSDLDEIRTTYSVNAAQAKAVKSALDNDAFTLIQGPPGSGKTKTICAIVGALLTGLVKKNVSNSRAAQSNGSVPAPPPGKKILVCAPSNAAVDELVMRFKDGVRFMNGSNEKLNVVRLGRSDAINAAVKDVTLEELVNAKLNVSVPGSDQKDDIHSVMMEHKSVSEQLNQHRSKMDGMRSQGQVPKPEDETLFDGLKRKKGALGSKIDEMREKQNTASRDAELNRRRMQQLVLDSAHVLCATLSGSGHELFQSLNVEFETVIIDEAAQSIELSALIPLKYGCSKCILVGDPKQLPPTVLSREAAKFQYEQSLFARMEGNHKKDVHLLDTQYRMHPEISVFPSKMFYDSRLKDGKGMAELRARPWHRSDILAPYRFFDVQGMSQSATKGHSLVNFAEIKVAIQLYERLTSDVPKYDFAGKVGIITPYKGQLRELKTRFTNHFGQNITSMIEFNTTDAFQGRESEIIIFSCVRASTQGLGFLKDIRRMNVGLTRAKCSLWVLGNSGALTQGEYWRGLVTDAQSRNLFTGGDIAAILNRPLLTEDMMKDDIVMQDGNSPVTSKEPPAHIVHEKKTNPAKDTKQQRHVSSSKVPDANRVITADSKTSRTPSGSNQSSRRSSMSGSAEEKRNAQTKKAGVEDSRKEQRPAVKRQHSGASSGPDPGQDVKDGRYGPSGGRFGLNSEVACNICGSNDHYTHNCNNDQAKEASVGQCRRCDGTGHSYAFCRAPRCLACGAVGHLEAECKAPLEQRLNKEQQEAVKRQEVDFGRVQDRAREKRAEKRLGEHAARIPTVISPAISSRKSLGESHDGKRKREAEVGGSRPKMPKTESAAVSGSLTGEAGGGNGRGPANGSMVRAGLPGRPMPGGGMVRKKKSNAEDMFMKRK